MPGLDRDVLARAEEVARGPGSRVPVVGQTVQFDVVLSSTRYLCRSRGTDGRVRAKNIEAVRCGRAEGWAR